MIIRSCLCIPTYNNPKTIITVVRDGLAKTQFPILIIDDGSAIPIQTLLDEAGIKTGELGVDRVALIRHPQNLGKGMAIQTAIRATVEKSFTHLMTMDGDGQHLMSELPKMVQAMVENPWDLILGNRKMVGESVPKVSKFGRKFSNFWVKYETEMKVADSQSGFRIYPLFHVQNFIFWTKKFDFEIEILIRLLWKNVHIREVDIDVYYPPADIRVSHFDKLWDNVRISFLNTILVALSLLRSQNSPAKAAFAIAIGVWIGCTPTEGFQTILALLVSLAFRLNFIWTGVGTLVSFLSIDSMLLGTLYATVIGFITYGVMFVLQKKKKVKAAWSGKNRGGKFGNWFLKNVSKYGGLQASYFCLYFIVPYFYLFAPAARRASNEYWKIIRPQEGIFHRQILVIKHLYRYAQVLLDRVYQTFHVENKFILNSNGIQYIIDGIERKKGLVVVGAHAGGWDLAARSLKDRGYDGNFTLVYYEAAGVTFNNTRNANEVVNIKHISSTSKTETGSSAAFNIRDSLKQGLPVGLMGDRPIGNQYELVSFMGKLAPFDTTPYRIATSCQAPLLFTFGFKGEGSHYHFYATEAKFYQFSSPAALGQERILKTLHWKQEFATVLEGYLKQYPDQWFNFFSFWSTPPQVPEGAGSGISRHHLVEELHIPLS